MTHRSFLPVLLLCVFVLLSPQPAAAQPAPQVTVFPLACTLCEARVAPDGKTAAVFENRDILGGEVDAPGQLAITLLDTATGRTLGQLRGQSDFTADAAFSPDGRTLASLHPNGDLRLWDLKSRKPLWERFVGAGAGRVAFTPDGKTVVASRAGMPQSLWLVDRQSGTVGPILSWRFDTFTELLDAVGEASGAFGYMLSAWAIAPDGKQIAAATVNDELWLFDLPGGAATRVLTNTESFGQFSIRSLGYTPDGAALYFGDSGTGSARVWSLETMTDTLPPAPAEEDGAPASDLYGLALSPEGDAFAWVDQVEGADGERTAQLVVAPVDDPSQPTLQIDLPAGLRATPPVRVFWTPDGRIIAGGFVNFEGENGLVVVEP